VAILLQKFKHFICKRLVLSIINTDHHCNFHSHMHTSHSLFQPKVKNRCDMAGNQRGGAEQRIDDQAQVQLKGDD
jgi:hypothetical protein